MDGAGFRVENFSISVFRNLITVLGCTALGHPRLGTAESGSGYLLQGYQSIVRIELAPASGELNTWGLQGDTSINSLTTLVDPSTKPYTPKLRSSSRKTNVVQASNLSGSGTLKENFGLGFRI